MPERLFFIQHGLSKGTGHWLRETRQWAAAARALGYEWHGFAHRSLDAALAQSVDVKPVIPFKPYDMLKTPPLIAPLASFIELGNALKQSLQAYLPVDIGAEDILFVGYTTPTELFGIAQWLDLVHPDRRPRVAFMFHQFDYRWKIDARQMQVSGDFSFWEYGARAVGQRLPAEKLRLYAAGEGLADVLATMFKLPVASLPLMMTPFTGAFRPQAEKTYDLGILNSGRKEQGSEVLPDVLALLLKMRADTKVLVQAADEEQAGTLRTELESRSPRARIDVAVTSEDETEFERRLGDVRLLLMAYVPESYCFRDSGIFIEAGCRAVPVAASRFSSMGRYIEAGQVAGAVFPYGDAPAMAACVSEALNNTAALSARAEALAPAWQAEHDPKSILTRAIGASWQ